MTEFGIILGMFAVTFGVRYPVLALVSRIDLPEWLRRSLKFVPPAVLAAITLPAVLIRDGNRLDLSPSNDYLLAGIVAAIVAHRTNNLLWTILSGMGGLFFLRAVLP